MLVEQTLQAISKKKKKKRANEDKETLILKAQKIKDMLQGFKGQEKKKTFGSLYNKSCAATAKTLGIMEKIGKSVCSEQQSLD